jgi:hypothetical protein
MQSVPITMNTAHGEVGVLDTTLCYKVVSDLWQVGGFHWVLRFPPSIKLTATI